MLAISQAAEASFPLASTPFANRPRTSAPAICHAVHSLSESPSSGRGGTSDPSWYSACLQHLISCQY